MNKISKEQAKRYLIIGIPILVAIFIVIGIIHYNVKGETNPPFKLTNIKIVSSAYGNLKEDFVSLDVIQKNDFYLFIEKNENYSKEDTISNVIIENFNIKKAPLKGNFGIFRPSEGTLMYVYNDEHKLENGITYVGSLTTNVSSLEIANQGGLIGFSLALTDLGTCTLDSNSGVINNGNLLSLVGVSIEDISMEVGFDIIIETSSGKKFKSSLTFNLPTGDIITENKTILNKTDFSDVIFKRF